VNKAQLVQAVAEKSGLTQRDAEKALTAMVESIQDALTHEDKVTLVGFGTFQTSKRAARQGHNPANGKPITIPAATVPVFKAGSALKDAVNHK
jgi:DNA-binding protein HU-beta